MSYDTNTINYESLDYGSYQMDYDDGYLSENVRYETIGFNKIHVRRVRLPSGTGNIIHLLSTDFEKTLDMIQSKIFTIPSDYRRIYYPQASSGTFMKRRYRFNVSRQKQKRFASIRNKTKLNPYPGRILQKTKENIFFSTGDIYESIKPITDRSPVKKNLTEFFSEFDTILKKMTPTSTNSHNKSNDNQILIIDADAFGFKQGALLQDNKSNPLLLLYLYFMGTRKISKMNVDIDMIIYSRNLFIKFNPARSGQNDWPTFKTSLFKIMNANLDEYIEKLPVQDQKDLDLTENDGVTKTIINNTLRPYTRNVSKGVVGTLLDSIGASIRDKLKQTLEISKMTQDVKASISKSINPYGSQEVSKGSNVDMDKGKSVVNTNPYGEISRKRMNLFNAIIDDYDKPLTTASGQFVSKDDEYAKELIEEYEDELEDDVQDLLNDDDIKEDVLEEIQDRLGPVNSLSRSPVNSARDIKLREAQKKISVSGSTIGSILERDKDIIGIESSDKSKVMKTSNQNMKQIRFTNFDKTYLGQLYTKDILGCFDTLKDKSFPFYITNVDIKDSSTAMDLKETWTVKMVDEFNKPHTIKVDIPKFHDNRFLWIGGNKYIILKQNFYNPIVKDTPDVVILTTNYNKITISRKATRSMASIEKIFTLVKRTSSNSKIFTPITTVPGGNKRYISSLEYDELSQRIYKFQSGSCELYFSRDVIKDWLNSSGAKTFKNVVIKGDEFVIGLENGQLVIINEDTGKDRYGRTITDIIEQNLPQQEANIFKTIKPPKQAMYAEAKLAGQFLPVAVVMLIWVGISGMLDIMKIRWRFRTDIKRIPTAQGSNRYIRFADGVLEYQYSMFSELVLNGLLKIYPERHTFKELDTEQGYIEYIRAIWGNLKGIVEIRNFEEFLVDHITKIVCRDQMLPTDAPGLLMHSVKLLADNKFKSKASDTSYRVRSIEQIPAILYSSIAAQYKRYVAQGGKGSISLDQRVVITALLKEKTVESYSTLNPAIEVGKINTISPKGYRGSNSDYSYDQEKRSYHPSSIGKLAMSTSPDANVGINRELVIEPTISNVRGYRDQDVDMDLLRDVNLFSPVEMMTPGTVRNDDPIRTSIANKQTQHLVPVEDAFFSLVSNGFDEAIQFHLSNDFVINAEEDGSVVEIDPKTGFTVVQYKSGKYQAYNNDHEIVKNSGGGFYTSNKLKSNMTKVGQTFKKDEVLAYHDKYFRESKLNGLRYSIGPLVKVAFLSTYNTYEDAGITTESLSDRMKTNIVYPEIAAFMKNTNILYMAEVGKKVNIGDVLIKFDTTVDDTTLSKYLTKLSSTNAALARAETKSDITTNHAGTIISIKIFTLLDPSNLSPSLGKIVRRYFERGLTKEKFLRKYDSSRGIVKAGYMLTDSTGPTVNRYNTIKGKYKGIDVLIEFYIENSDVMGIGDKIAIFGPNKQIISEVIPKGYEGYSDFRPEEEISVISSPGTIARRMTPSIQRISAATKVLIELKRKIKEEIRYR